MSTDELVAKVRSLDPEHTSSQTAKKIWRQAKRQRKTYLRPSWLVHRAKSPAAQKVSLTSTDAMSTATSQPVDAISEVHMCLAAKSQEHLVPLPVLRTVFQRGVREFATLDSRPPATHIEFAQARVNSFVRLVYGDPDARCCDIDLLTHVPDMPRR